MPQLNSAFGDTYGVIAATIGGFGMLALGFVYAVLERDIRHAGALGVTRMHPAHVALPGIVTAFCLLAPLLTTLFLTSVELGARAFTVALFDVAGLTCAVALHRTREVLFPRREAVWILMALVAAFTGMAVSSHLGVLVNRELVALVIFVLGLSGGWAVCLESIQKSDLVPLCINDWRIRKIKADFASAVKAHHDLCLNHGVNPRHSAALADLSFFKSEIYKGPARSANSKAITLECWKQWKEAVDRCKTMMSAHATLLKAGSQPSNLGHEARIEVIDPAKVERPRD